MDIFEVRAYLEHRFLYTIGFYKSIPREIDYETLIRGA